MMIWGVICRESACPMISQHGRINCQDFLEVLSCQVHPMVQVMLPEENALFQDDDDAPIHTASIVMEWHEEHSDVQHLVWPPQSPNLNIEHQWFVLDLANNLGVISIPIVSRSSKKF